MNRRDTIKRILKIFLCFCAVMAIPASYTCTLSASEIKMQMDEAKQKQQQAHQIAEYVREFGEPDSHPAIAFAKGKWQEQQEILDTLQQAYQAAQAQEEQKGTYLGRFWISHYCPCTVCNGGYTGTATGAPLTPWHTIAVDASVIPLGSTVHIDGYGDFIAQDTGGAIYGNRIDVCVPSHQEAYKLGVIYKDVYVKYE